MKKKMQFLILLLGIKHCVICNQTIGVGQLVAGTFKSYVQDGLNCFMNCFNFPYLICPGNYFLESGFKAIKFAGHFCRSGLSLKIEETWVPHSLSKNVCL